jgi:hypothetical protein
MALSKIQAESMNLADDFAFTGTVTGTPDTSDMKLLLSDTVSSLIGQYEISSTYINSTYDTYYLDASFDIQTDNTLFYMNPFVGGVISNSGIAYNNFNMDTGQRIFSDSSSIIRLSYSGVGSASGECGNVSGYLQNVNSTTLPFVFSGITNYYTSSGVHQSNSVGGGHVVGNRALVVNGLRLWFSGSSIEEGTVKLYGLRK